MVGEPESDIEVESFEWDEGNISHLEEVRHGATVTDVEQVRLNAPRYFANHPDKSGSHVMIGPNDNDIFFYVVLVETSIKGRWRPVTGWRMNRQRALKMYIEG